MIHDLISYKGNDITVRELAEFSDACYATVAARVRRNPLFTGEEILKQKPKTLTYKGETKKVVQWIKIFEINDSTFRSRIKNTGIEKTFEYYRKKKREKHRETEDVDISIFEFDINLHAERLLDSGLSYLQVFNRMKTAGLL